MLNDSPIKDTAVVNIGRMDTVDVVMMLAVNIIHARENGVFDQWLERMIAANEGRLPCLVSAMMAASELMQHELFDEMAKIFIEDGRMGNLIEKNEVPRQ